MSKLIHIADRVLNRPLMVLPEKLALIASVLEGRINIDATDLKEIEADAHLQTGPDASRFVGSPVSSDGTKYKPYRVDSGVAAIPVLGSLVNRGAWIGARSGMTSYEGLAFQLGAAAKDPEVHAIILDMDSPGGEAVGAFEIADKVRAVAKLKPITAVVNGMAASAAYAIASAATKIVSTPSGVSGSIGVVMMHADYSHALHDKGIKPTLIHAGARKVDGNPYEPLSDNVKADFKAEVDQFYDLFVSSVAAGRKGRMTEKSVRGTEARTYIGQAALNAGLVDAIGSFETVLADLSKKAPKVAPQRKDGLQLAVAPSVANGPTGPRSAEDCAQIEKAAAGDHRLAAQVRNLCGTPYENCSQADALTVMEITKQSWSRHDVQNSVHESGLFLGNDHPAVRGGPLFVSPGPGPSETQTNDLWGDVVADINRKNKLS